MIRDTQNAKRNTTFQPAYKKLLVWQIADGFAKQIYLITKTFPKIEMYGLTSQLRRASLSIPLNIIEGYSRNSKNEFRQFLRISLGSLAEASYVLEFAYEQKYLTQYDFEKLISLRERCGQLLWKLFKSQEI